MKHINKFARLLRENFLEVFVKEYLATLNIMDAPIMRLISHLSDEDIFQMALASSDEFLVALENNNELKLAKERLQAWEEDKLPGIPKDKVLPSDLVLVYYAQKVTLFKFIPRYTAECDVTLEIILNLEDYFVQVQDIAIKMLFNIKEEFDRQKILTEELEKKIEERTHLLAETNKELEAFAYSVSHDLRAPLRSINGYSKIILEEYGTQLNEDIRQNLDIIVNNATMMGQLIDDLLSFSKLGRKELQRTRLDMNKLVKSLIKELNSYAGEKAKIVVHPLPEIYADEMLLKQVVSNLLSNALKYSSKKDEPSVEVGAEKKDNEVIYYVKDNGAGFNMKYYNKLFGVFQRLHRQDEFEGTGVGLAIVQRIISKHKGKIWAESETGTGATFYFSLKTE